MPHVPSYAPSEHQYTSCHRPFALSNAGHAPSSTYHSPQTPLSFVKQGPNGFTSQSKRRDLARATRRRSPCRPDMALKSPHRSAETASAELEAGRDRQAACCP